MPQKNNEITLIKLALIILTIIVLVHLFVFIQEIRKSKDDGTYNYCIEWAGLNGGTLYRDNLLYTCYSLATQSFKCDYEIDNPTQILTIKPIINVTKDKQGFITEINYGDPLQFNCTRWLKSK